MLGNQTLKNVMCQSFSGKQLCHYPAWIHSLCEVKEAALETNGEIGLLSTMQKAALMEAINLLKGWARKNNREFLNTHFPVDVCAGGGSIGLHFNISEFLSLKSGVDISFINQSQSTADVCHTAGRITIIKSAESLFSVLDEAIFILKEKSRRWMPLKTLARTCLQDACTMSLGESFSAYPEALSRRLHELKNNLQLLKQVNLGGTVIGSKESIDPRFPDIALKHLQRISGLSLSHRNNLFDAAQNSDDLGAFSAHLTQLALVLMKIARDIRLLCSGPKGGFGELHLPKLQQGSSFFGDKNNPIVAETLMHCGFLILGADRVVQASLEQAELQLNVFENIIIVQILDGLDWLFNALKLFVEYGLKGLEPNEERCAILAAYAQPQKMNG